MSKRDNFAGGFLLGTLVGGLVGTVVGIVVGARSNETEDARSNQSLDDYENSSSQSRLQSNADFSDGLEAKITQLNLAIDEVRQKLNLVDAEKSEEEHL